MMNSNTYKRGFTLIELLVVIAIIGILASVVLASLNTARDKGSDAAAKGAMSQLRSQAELFYDSGRTYVGMCASAPVLAIRANAQANAYNQNATLCNESLTAWAAEVDLKSANGSGNRYFCVDSTGQTNVGATSKAATTVCP